MDRSDMEQLILYTAERARGIVHTPEWVQRMEDLQARFDLEDSQLKAERAATESKTEAIGRVG